MGSAPPSFRTARLALRPLELADIDACLAMDDDPEVMRYVGTFWHDPASHRAYSEARVRHAYPQAMGYWAVLAGEEFVGWILLGPLDRIGPEVEIGWRFARDAWGHGYATEAARALIAHGFDTLALGEIVADADPENRRSIRVAEKLGMQLLGPAMHAGYRVVRFVTRAGARAECSDPPCGKEFGRPPPDERPG
ncbi:MAG: GNAT family N-acetyltransferase [Acetobacteraceae bacterium]